jgi:hypothetical protein
MIGLYMQINLISCSYERNQAFIAAAILEHLLLLVFIGAICQVTTLVSYQWTIIRTSDEATEEDKTKNAQTKSLSDQKREQFLKKQNEDLTSLLNKRVKGFEFGIIIRLGKLRHGRVVAMNTQQLILCYVVGDVYDNFWIIMRIFCLETQLEPVRIGKYFDWNL